MIMTLCYYYNNMLNKTYLNRSVLRFTKPNKLPFPAIVNLNKLSPLVYQVASNSLMILPAFIIVVDGN